jgi:transcriptional regulator with XRE-family HTH domain
MQEKKTRVSLTVAHLRAARGLLNWSLDELADRAGITRATIHNWESGRHSPMAATRDKIRDAFEREGVMFLNGGNPGVRLIRDPLQLDEHH